MSRILALFDDMTGVVFDYAFSTPPSAAWLMCYGQALADGDDATAKLRGKLITEGYPFGQSGDDPLLPDARGRVVAGLDNMGGTAAGRLTNSGTGNPGIDGASLGATGGAQSHTLSTAQMPQHSHGVNDPGHTHTLGFDRGTRGTNSNITTGAEFVDTSTSTTNSRTTGISINNTGSGNAHPNAQPTIVLNKIIHL